MKEDCIQKNMRIKKLVAEHLKELSEEENCSETQIVENALNLYYSKEILPEHIVLGRITQMESQLTAIDRKLETFAGVFYLVMPVIFGCIPQLPKTEVDKNGRKYSPAIDKGNDIFTKILKNYRVQMKTHKISFMQNVWADMQENLDMTNINAASEGLYERATGN